MLLSKAFCILQVNLVPRWVTSASEEINNTLSAFHPIVHYYHMYRYTHVLCIAHLDSAGMLCTSTTWTGTV